MGTTYIVITTRFEALHYWNEVPNGDTGFLGNLHRHIFHITMKWKVGHDDRQIEFIQQKRKIEKYIDERLRGKNLRSKSCEMIARELADFNADFVSVFEDNENGCEWIK